MATIPTIRTRLKLRFDTLSNWENVNPILEAGEAAIAIVDTETPDYAAGKIVVKFGDGDRAYKSLPVPSTRANDIAGLSEFIAGKVEDTDTQYRIVNKEGKYILQSKALGGDWANVEGSEIDFGSFVTAEQFNTTLSGYVTSGALSTTLGNYVTSGTLSTTLADYVTTLALNTILANYAPVDALNSVATDVTALKEQIKGLTSAMHFVGVKDSVPTDVSGYKLGDVIVVGNKEYVFDGSKFVEFGDASANAQAITNLTGRVSAIEADYIARGELDERLNSLESSLKADSKNKADAALADAKVYTNTSIAGAKSYTDTAVSDAKAYADGQINAMLSAGFILDCGGAGESTEEPEQPTGNYFYIAGTPYAMPADSKWTTFVNSHSSEYSILEATNEIIATGKGMICHANGNSVKSTETITAGESYIIEE